jgi:glycosyltransferase involved in cell wall biosynthesis
MSVRLATPPERLEAAAVLCRQGPDAEGPRVLAVARWPVGGIRTHLHYHYLPLAAAGYRFTFVGPDDASLETLRAGLGRLAGAEFVGVPIRGRSCRLWAEVRRLLRTRRFALMHAHGLTAGVHCAAAGFGLGVPLAVTLHEPLRPAQFPGLLGRLKRWAMGAVLRRADRIIAVSEDARANLLSHLPTLGKRADRLITVPNGIDTDRYGGTAGRSSNALRQRLGVGAGTALFGYLGRFMPEKGFPVLLEALKLLAGRYGCERFHLVAFGSDDYRREYQQRIDQEGLGRVATLLDFVPDVEPVLADLNLVVVPSLWEASSLVSMEALSAGVPVLGSDCPGLREVLRGTPSVPVRTGDVSALAEGLARFLEAPWTREARAFAPVARDRFDRSRSVRRLQELFAELVVQ